MQWLIVILLTTFQTLANSKYASPCLSVNQQHGMCMPVKSCKVIYDMFTRTIQSGDTLSELSKKRLSSLHCGTFKNVPHVCCPQVEVQFNAEGLDILKNNTCGIYMQDTVANGQTARLFQFPWMALLKYNDEVDPFKCGGSLISDQYVLTAAHCVKGKEHLLTAVRLGEYQISSPIDCTNFTRKNQCAPPVEDVEIEELIIHDNYEGIYNDIALIRLNRKVEFKRHIKPICLPIYPELQTKIYDNYAISGWGRTEKDTNSDILMAAFVPNVNRTDCENQLRKYKLRDALDESHICAGGQNLVDTCRGDSGGPLSYHDSYNGRPRIIQFGIVSIGLRNCGTVNVPAIYTNVSYHMQWLTDNIKNVSGKAVEFEQRSLPEESCKTPALENGFCVAYQDCAFIKELAQNYGSKEAIPKHYLQFIQKSRCSRPNEPIRLCCKASNAGGDGGGDDGGSYTKQTTNTPPVVVTQSNEDPRFTEDLNYSKDFDSQFSAQGLSILKSFKCGKDDSDKVSGGNETDLAEFPWMALLRYDSPGDEFKCGGSLISNRYVLTATHCVNKPVYPVIGVRLGEHDLTTNPDCRQKFRKNICNPVVEDFGVEKVIQQPKYNQRKHINDIALIKLDRDVQFKKNIKPVCLPLTRQSYENNPSSFTIAGWGGTENGTRSLVLLKAEVWGQERSLCQNVFASYSLDINIKHICAGDLQTGRDTCRGDSGGPLFAFNTYTNTKNFIQYGVVASGGIACNLEQNLPGIYTNVLTFLPWITHNIVD